MNTSTIISTRAQSIKPSPTLAVAAKAKELKAAGHDIIDLGVGEPDFDTPEHVKQAAIAAIKAGYTKYTAVDGIPELKQAIVAKLARDHQLDYKVNQILVSCGAKQSIFNLAQAMLNNGDEVIIPAPYWVSYPDIVTLCEATTVIVKTGIEQNFKLTPDQLAQSITAKTKLFIINSPSNPTGVGYSKAELAALGAVLRKHPQVYILSDDIYEYILWGKEPFANILMACPDLYNRTILVNGVSKAYAMTGWRIGYAAGDAKIIKEMTKIQGQSTSNPCSISQYAAVAALNGSHDFLQEMLTAFKARHDYIVKELNSIAGIECLPVEGAFYAFFKVEGLINKLRGKQTSATSNDTAINDTTLAEMLIQKANIALVPGAAFGAPGYLRLSFATSMAMLREAVRRLREFAAITL